MRTEIDLDGWWQRWFDRRDPVARDRLIVHYSPLVKFVAGRVGAGLPNSVDPGDLVSAGVFGLIDAVERFDPERGVKFETFAVPRIRGAVFDGLRSLDWVPRSVRSRAREVENAFQDLEGKLGRAPSDEELSGQLKISGTEFQKWLAATARSSWWTAAWWPAPSRGHSPGMCPIRPRRWWRRRKCAAWCAAS